MDVEEAILALEAPLRVLKQLGRSGVEEILEAALDDVFEEEEGA